MEKIPGGHLLEAKKESAGTTIKKTRPTFGRTGDHNYIFSA
jgi:hypothetical protein